MGSCRPPAERALTESARARRSQCFFERACYLPASAHVRGPCHGLLGDDRARALAARLGGANAESCDNLLSVETLITREPLAIAGGIARYWTGPSRQRFSACDSWDEYRA